MKLATFEIPTAAGPLRRIGAAVDGRLIDLAAGYAAHLERPTPDATRNVSPACCFLPTWSHFSAPATSGARRRSGGRGGIETSGSVRWPHELRGERSASAGSCAAPARDPRFPDLRRAHADGGQSARAAVDSAGVVRSAGVLQRRSRHGVRPGRRDRVAEVLREVRLRARAGGRHRAPREEHQEGRRALATSRATRSGTTGARAISR